MENQNEDVESGEEVSLHIESQTSECAECQNRRKFIQIIDVDRYIDRLNYWD